MRLGLLRLVHEDISFCSRARRARARTRSISVRSRSLAARYGSIDQ